MNVNNVILSPENKNTNECVIVSPISKNQRKKRVKFSILLLLSKRGGRGKGGFFEIWVFYGTKYI